MNPNTNDDKHFRLNWHVTIACNVRYSICRRNSQCGAQYLMHVHYFLRWEYREANSLAVQQVLREVLYFLSKCKIRPLKSTDCATVLYIDAMKCYHITRSIYLLSSIPCWKLTFQSIFVILVYVYILF